MDIRQFFFQYRSFTPIPLILLLFYLAQPKIYPFVFGLLLALVGEGLRWWAVAHAGGETRTRQVGAGELVTSGPFAHVRNPLYLANLFIIPGFVLMAGGGLPWMLGVGWAFWAVQYSLIISLEEETLDKLFGDTYRRYRNKVPRFLPLLKGQTPEGRTTLPLRKVLRSERSTLLGLLLLTGGIILRGALFG